MLIGSKYGANPTVLALSEDYCGTAFTQINFISSLKCAEASRERVTAKMLSHFNLWLHPAPKEAPNCTWLPQVTVLFI